MFVLINFGEKSTVIIEDLRLSSLFVGGESKWVLSDAALAFLSETSLPVWSAVPLRDAAFSRILRASLVLPFRHRYLGDSGARPYNKSTMKEGTEESAINHLHP